jgi:beta-1,4-mannosyl-glycoprotein beta-1,4-N-acetylglucosaminyltransferase
MKVADCFIFFNELDILDLRLNILNDKVDHFILVESTVTHAGNPKPLYYKDNKHLFEKFNHKIVHCIVEDTPNSFAEAQKRFLNPKDELDKNILMHCLTTPNLNHNQTQWLREFYQHESIRRGLLMAGMQEDDVCFNSDVDEIWNPEVEYPILDLEVVKLKQHVYTGFLNLKSEEEWFGTYYTKYKNIKNASSNHLDSVQLTNHIFLDNGGWHFTFQGGYERIKTKIENYGHQEYNNDQVKNLIEHRLKDGMDVLGRPFRCVVDNDSLPNYIKQNTEKYKNNLK